MLGRRLIGKSRAAQVGRRSDRRSASVRAALEGLEDRRLMSADPLAHVNDVQPLPFVLEFDAPVDGLHDNDGQDVGLTRVQVNENGLAASYLPANVDLRTDLGVLRVTSTGTSTAGSNFNNDNTLTNALETQFDATTAGWQVTTRLVGPLGFLDRASEQGGVYFGPDQDNYVKLVASVTTASNVASIEFTDEQLNGTSYVHSVSSKTDVGPFAAINTLDLRLVGDATTGKVTAFYALNGGAFQKVAAEVTLPTDKRPAFFNAAGRAGLITAHKNDVGPVTVTYDRFEIQPGQTPDPTARPSVIATRPATGATGVARDGYIAADLSLPNGGVDSATLSAATVKLYRTGDGAPVPGEPGTTGGGDQILFTPAVLLDPNTRYTFEITDGVHDSTGAAFLPFSTSFTTASAAPPIDPTLSFEKVRLPSTAGLRFTALKVGPDGKLYAGVVDGRIIRYTVNDDGTLGAAQTITTLQTANGGNRLLTGITFDPASTAANPVLWVTHGQYAFGETTTDYADDWTSKLTKLSGPALATVQDVLVNLPRSARDHLTNQPTFGPDGALYFPQGSNSSMGAPDPAWDHRIERMLSGAVLRLDPRKLPATLPLDVKTPDGGGAYDPSAAGAPLTLYATGVRNAFDLVWTRDGTLYAPTNGSAAGGSTPYGPGVPGLEAVKTTQHDFLFNVQPGGYYGHPNPVRDQFVMGGGYTPANGLGVNEVAEYGAATGGLAVNPDPNYRGYAWDFGLNISPNGALEYANTNAFGGMLAGKILVTRYSGPGDIVVLTRNPDGSIRSQNTGVAGLKGFVDPIDITEDPSTGNLYVSDYGQRNGAARQIYLLRPIPAGANLSTGKDQLVFSDIITSAHAGPSPNLSLRITNTGTVPLAFPTGGVRVIDDPATAGDDSGLFKVVNAASLPDTIGVGESFDVVLNFTAPAVGIESAFLRIQSNDADRPTFDVALRGVGVPGTGGANEPSLARILRAYQIPTIVGDGPNDSGEADTAYPLNPDPSSQEVAGMQRLVKAGTGPVTFEVLAAEAINTNPSVKFGYYTPGNRGWDSKRELFTISGADAQSLQATPNGVTSFDPGQSAFGLYTIYPGFQKPQDGGLPREVFSEDALNLWDATASRRHKVRFFPLREKNGTVVPNAYIVAFEEFDTAFDSNDLVAIVRNVRPAPAGPELGLENMDVVPFSDRLAFNKIQNYVNSDRPNNSFHQTAVMRIRNTGSAPLVLGTLSTTGDFTLDSPPPAGTSIAPGAFLDLTVRFTATSSTNGKMKLGTLTVNSNDADEPATVIQLGGYWQSRNEGGQEPGLQEIVNTYGFKTQIIYSGQVLNQGGRIVRVGDEVLSPYWFRADTSSPATARQLAAFHTQGNTASLYWHAKGSTTVTKLFTEDGVWGQSFLPPLSGSNGTLPSFAAFSPTGAFGWRIDGKEWSDPTKNPAPAGQPQDQGHHVRFWVARDRTGAIIPNTYIMSMDYAGINYDYNDNVFLLTNIRPESPPKAPTAVVASGGGGGIGIDWADQTEANLGGYNVYRSAAATGPWTKLTATPVTASAFADLFAPANATSFYYVTAVDLNGTESGASLVVSASRSNDTTPPARPASLTATGLTTGITLDWTDNAEADLSGYNVLRAASSAGPFTKLNPTILKASSFVDITAAAGVTSYYQVIAIDLSGNVSAAATASAVRPSSTSLPNSPPSTSANAVSQTRIDVSWGAATNATTYRLERKGPGEANFTEVAAGLTGLTYTDNAVAAGGTYAYRVRAENSAGLSGYGPLATATTPTNPVPPAAPGGTTATAVNAGRVDVSWSAPAGATSYRLERQGPGETAFREIAAGLSGTSYQDTAVLPSSTYQYRVRAQNAAGLSGYGPTAGATTPAVVTGAYAGADVGRVRPSAGSTVVVAEGKAYDVTAGGADIQGTADEFHFAYRQVSGDFDMKVRVASLTRANEWTKAGLMIREGLAAGSANVFVMATPDVHGYRLTYRPTDGGSTLAKGTGLVSYPNTWVRLQRRGDVVSGYRSSDGVNWLLVGSARLTLPQAVYFGMAVTSHNAAATATAQFRDLADVATTTPPPAAPATLSATPFSPTAINLSWAASPGATGYRIERLNPGAADYVPIITSVPGTTYQDTGLQASTTYVYRVRAENAGGASAYSPTAGATTQPNPTTGSLTGVDVGPTAPAGSTREIVAGRDYDVTAGGADISGTVDQFHFAYKQVTGDFDVKVRVQSLTNTSSFAKAGIMARTGLGAGAANVMALITPAEQGARLTFRRTDGAITESTGSGSAPAVFPNAWIRLRRVGDTFTYFRSADGVTWTGFKSITLALGPTMYLGLAATSHNTAAATVAQFRGFGNV